MSELAIIAFAAFFVYICISRIISHRNLYVLDYHLLCIYVSIKDDRYYKSARLLPGFNESIFQLKANSGAKLLPSVFFSFGSIK